MMMKSLCGLLNCTYVIDTFADNIYLYLCDTFRATHRSDTTATHTQLKLTWAAIIELQAEIENAKDQLKAMHSDSKKQVPHVYSFIQIFRLS